MDRRLFPAKLVNARLKGIALRRENFHLFPVIDGEGDIPDLFFKPGEMAQKLFKNDRARFHTPGGSRPSVGSCGHHAVPHGAHVGYRAEGRLHHPQDDHCDDHGPLRVVS